MSSIKQENWSEMTCDRAIKQEDEDHSDLLVEVSFSENKKKC